MELDKLQSLIDMLRANGVTSYKDGQLELSLGAAPKQVLPAEVEEKSTTQDLNELEEAISGGLDPQYRQLFTVQAGA